MSAGKAVALVVGGALVGSGVTILVLKKKYEAQAEEEIASVRDSYIKRLRDLAEQFELKTEKVPAPPVDLKVTPGVPMERVVPSTDTLRKAYNKIPPNLETVEGLKETVEGLGYSRKEEPVEESVNVSEEPKNKYEYLDVDKDINVPYVIPVQAYMDGEEAYDQFTFTYYSGDKTLANEAEEVVTDINGVVGFHNLDKFGEESGNNDTVYIRNDRLAAEYEVLRDPGKYSSNVMSVDSWDETPDSPIKRFR